MAEEGALGRSRQEMVDRFTRIPGLGRSRAEMMYDAGYTNLGLLRKATVEELTRIPGVGMSLARCVKNNLDLVKEEVSGEVAVAVPAGPLPPAPAGIVVGESPSAPEKRPEEPARPEPVKPPQQKGFISSLFDKILGKPAAPKPASGPGGPDKKEDEGKGPEKKEPDAKGPEKKEPDAKGPEKKEPDAKGPESEEAGKGQSGKGESETPGPRKQEPGTSEPGKRDPERKAPGNAEADRSGAPPYEAMPGPGASGGDQDRAGAPGTAGGSAKEGEKNEKM